METDKKDKLTKNEIIGLYINDLKNLVTESPARENRISMLESELVEQEQESFKTAEEILNKIYVLKGESDDNVQRIIYYEDAVKAMHIFACQSKPLPSDEEIHIWARKNSFKRLKTILPIPDEYLATYTDEIRAELLFMGAKAMRDGKIKQTE